MTKILCTRVLEIDAGHRVHNHESKCAHPHGHRYKFELVAEAEKLDSLGRIVDFSVIKDKVGSWLNFYWDHAFLYSPDDILTKEFLEFGNYRRYCIGCNPTAENMAAYLLEKSNQLLSEYGVTVTGVICWETPNCKAEAWLS